jgi:hypothetical protein
MKVSVHKTDRLEITKIIKNNIGNSLEFSNGCYIDLKETSGFYFGETPYGVTWCCDPDKDFITKIILWLDYWNTPRDENGDTI